VIVFLLSTRSAFVTGEVVRVDGGMLARIGGSPKGGKQ
jgi:NAD(P)-dependent dehydrogenase (short-subunit alcohol dehydrogenase family)